jgi:hypothetical protein
LPLSFEINQGQADPLIDFVAHGHGYVLSLSAGEAQLSLRQPRTSPGGTGTAVERTSVVRIQPLGVAALPRAMAEEPLQGITNYFVGNDSSQWHTEVSTFGRVRYLDIYPGVDLVYYGNQGQLEYDFVVAPGAEVNLIRLGISGADDVAVDGAGDLVMQVAGRQLRQRHPVLYQKGAYGRQTVTGGYVMNQLGELGFAVSPYDATRPLIIDPLLVYSTFLGGSDEDDGLAIAVDSTGSAYVTGRTFSANFRPLPALSREPEAAMPLTTHL